MLRDRKKPAKDSAVRLVSNCLAASRNADKVQGLTDVQNFIKEHGEASLPLLCEAKIFQTLTKVLSAETGDCDDVLSEILALSSLMLGYPGIFVGQIRTAMAQSGLLARFRNVEESSHCDAIKAKAEAIVRMLQAPLPATVSTKSAASTLKKRTPRSNTATPRQSAQPDARHKLQGPTAEIISKIDGHTASEKDLCDLFEIAKGYEVENVERAFTCHTACLKGRRHLLGDLHYDTAKSLFELAKIEERRGNLEEALSLLKKRLQVPVRSDVETDRFPVTYLLGCVYNKLGKTDLAITALKKDCLEKQEKRLGEEHPDVISTRLLLAEVCQNHGDSACAEEYFRSCLMISQKTVGDSHTGVISAKRGLSRVLSSMGNYAEAFKLLLEAATASNEAVNVIDDTHQQVQLELESVKTELQIKVNQLASQARKDVSVINDMKKLLVDLQHHVGYAHEETLKLLRSIVDVCKCEQRDTATEVLSSSIHYRSEKPVQSDEEELLVDSITLAELYISSGNSIEAIRILDEVRKKQYSLRGSLHPGYFRTMRLFLGTKFKAGDSKSAAAVAEECLFLERYTWDWDNSAEDRLSMMLLHARALLVTDNDREATEILEKCLSYHEVIYDKRNCVTDDHVTTIKLLADVYTKSDVSIQNIKRIFPLRRRALWLSLQVQSFEEVQKTSEELKGLFKQQDDALSKIAEPLRWAKHREKNANPYLLLPRVSRILEAYISLYGWDPSDTSEGSISERALRVFSDANDSDNEKLKSMYKIVRSWSTPYTSFMWWVSYYGVICAQCEHYDDAALVLSYLCHDEAMPSIYRDVLYSSHPVLYYSCMVYKALGKQDEAVLTAYKWFQEHYSRVKSATCFDAFVSVIRWAMSSTILTKGELQSWFKRFLIDYSSKFPPAYYECFFELLPIIEDEAEACKFLANIRSSECLDRNCCEHTAELHYREALYWKERGNYVKMIQSVRLGNKDLSYLAKEFRQPKVLTEVTSVLRQAHHTGFGLKPGFGNYAKVIQSVRLGNKDLSYLAKEFRQPKVLTEVT
eukprot:Rmarinus@m.4112